MVKIGYLIVVFTCFSLLGNAQSYAPAAGTPGTTAIHKNDPIYKAWATGIEVTRGYRNIANPALGYAETGTPEMALGFPNGEIVSLGDKGEAILTFANPIYDGDGFDFAVFENGSVGYLELALVEVSSDGIHFFGFPTHSETQTNTQIGTFGTPSAAFLKNIAGKYEGTYGTPFDVSEVQDHPLLDKQNITHVKVIDVVGSIDPNFGTRDSLGNLINDSYPTPFPASGFDLQAVGIINEKVLNTNTFQASKIQLYPNPARDVFHVNTPITVTVQIYDLAGRLVKTFSNAEKSYPVSDLAKGTYTVKIYEHNNSISKKLRIE